MAHDHPAHLLRGAAHHLCIDFDADSGASFFPTTVGSPPSLPRRSDDARRPLAASPPPRRNPHRRASTLSARPRQGAGRPPRRRLPGVLRPVKFGRSAGGPHSSGVYGRNPFGIRPSPPAAPEGSRRVTARTAWPSSRSARGADLVVLVNHKVWKPAPGSSYPAPSLSRLSHHRDLDGGALAHRGVQPNARPRSTGWRARSVRLDHATPPRAV